MRVVSSAILIEKLLVSSSWYLIGNMFLFNIFTREYEFEFWRNSLGREFGDILEGDFTR